jgi:hypothetical protein
VDYTTVGVEAETALFERRDGEREGGEVVKVAVERADVGGAAE